jgi:hypothetical protein
MVELWYLDVLLMAVYGRTSPEIAAAQRCSIFAHSDIRHVCSTCNRVPMAGIPTTAVLTLAMPFFMIAAVLLATMPCPSDILGRVIFRYTQGL